MSEPTRTPARITRAAVALVALVAAVVSYAHMQHLALEAGEGWRSHLLPLSVDGFLVTAAMSMLHARQHGRVPTWLARSMLALGIAASLGANIAAAEPTLVGRMVAAWPPLALALATELLVQQGRHHTRAENSIASGVAALAPHAGAGTDTAASLIERTEPPTLIEDGAPTQQRASHEGASARTQRARAGGSVAQGQARAVFEQARAAGRAEEVTGAALADAAGVHPGTARKWLAAWRAELATDKPAKASSTDDTTTHATERGEEVAA